MRPARNGSKARRDEERSGVQYSVVLLCSVVCVCDLMEVIGLGNGPLQGFYIRCCIHTALEISLVCP